MDTEEMMKAAEVVGEGVERQLSGPESDVDVGKG